MTDRHTQIKKALLASRVIGIIRGIDADFFPDFMAAVFAGGLTALEVTVNTGNGYAMVAGESGRVPSGSLLGMGTVRTPEEARRAMDAGASFLVTPNVHPDVLRLAGRQGVPVVAGALTPTEVANAWGAGAAMVKVFPCGAMGGPGYIRELRGPFDAVPLVPVGGVRPENVAAYFDAGAVAVGVGTALFGAKALADRDCAAIQSNVTTFLDYCPSTEPAPGWTQSPGTSKA